MKIISVCSTKGGVGKTITTVHLGAALAQAGHATLLIDIDLQHGLTSYFNRPVKGLTTSHVLVDNARIDDAACQVRDNLFLIPATEEMERTEVTLLTRGGGELFLRRAIRQFCSESEHLEIPLFDFVLIDCPSGWGAVTRNAILASNGMIIPVNSEPAAYTNAIDTERSARNLANVHEHQLSLCGVLLTRWREENASNAVAAKCEAQWKSDLFSTRIRQAAKVNELAIRRVTAGDVSKSAGGAVREDYQALANEVVERCLNQK